MSWLLINAHWNNQNQASEKIKWVTDFYNELAPYLKGSYQNTPDLELENALEKYYG